MSIRGKLLAAFAALIVLAAAQGLFAVKSVTDTGGLVADLYDGPLMAISFARSAETRFSEASRLNSNAISLSQSFGSAGDIEPISTAFEEFLSDLDVVAERMSGHDEAAGRLAAVRDLATQWKTKSDVVLLGRSEDGSGAVTSLPSLSQIQRIGDRIETELEALVEVATAYGYSFRMDAEETVGRTVIVDVVLVGLVLLAGILATIVLSRDIGSPIKAMTRAMSRLAEGDNTAEVPCVGRRDEIGAMAKAVEVFKRNGLERERLQVRQAEEAAAREERARLIDSLTGRFSEDVGETLRSVATAAGQLEGTAQSMTTIAEETDQRSATVASAANEAASNVQTVASATEELTSSIAEIGHQVAQSTQASEAAVAETRKAGQTAQGLSAAAQKIGDVVNLISDIAAQTNLLALNATIEAARAGESGKGFAVVASEVKALATQTARATEEIGAQIAAMQQESAGAVAAMEGVQKVIGDVSSIAAAIASAVEEQNAATSEIARNIQQAALGTDEVTKSIQDVAEGTTETRAAGSQVLSASRQLSTNSDTLKEVVERFLTEIRAA